MAVSGGQWRLRWLLRFPHLAHRKRDRTGQEDLVMPFYLTRFSYTPETWVWRPVGRTSPQAAPRSCRAPGKGHCLSRITVHGPQRVAVTAILYRPS